MRRQPHLAGVVAVERDAKQRMGADLGQRQQAQLRKAALSAGSGRAAEALLQIRRVRQIDRGAVQADQPAATIPGAGRVGASRTLDLLPESGERFGSYPASLSN
jgi:hypothetical protein